ncbi:mandelate racemase/muconate lactonizing enzyme family protein [Saliphagus infecundisoli]|uniref:Mandelate racemase/muconate lactonizing enzyme family protein n=1 Tax=Saliphagus infecundisoli TaxID=1849069 RepID=A0ABD5QBI9_9EURY|nr:mandelate racemase/muconate lactonizing enzyme family protein [Saliphagus infecundisoli]
MVRISDQRDIEITDIQTTKVAGNFEWTLVRVYSDAGITGTGEAVLGPKADAYIEYAKDVVIGKNPTDIDARCTELFDQLAHYGAMNGIAVTAISGIDIALHDLAGKVLDVPAYQLLGGKHRDEVRVYCDSHAGEHLRRTNVTDDYDPYSPESYADAAEDVVEDGFDALKFDLDATDRYELDQRNKHLNARAIEYRTDIVEAVTERVGDRADVAFDCHWSWTGDSIRRLAKAIEPYPVWWLEDTVPPENHDVQIQVTHSTDTTIAAGENVYRVEGARRLIENQGLDILHPDVPKTGGMLETKKMADLAKAYYVPLALHNVSSPIGTMASAHVAAAASNFLAMEYHARDVDWWADLVAGSDSIIEDGCIAVPDKAGLGVDLDLDVVEDRMVEGETLFDPAQ